LVVALWDPVSATFHDAGGRPVRPEANRGRRATVIDRGGAPLALVLHDQALPAAARLTEAVAAAVSLLDAHAALQQALGDRIAEVRRSRRRLLLAADAEREALARELARGPGARLAALRRRIAETAPDVADDAAADDLAEAAQHLAVTAEDLDALLSGLRPAELDQGLASALTALADRSPVPVALDLRHTGAVAAEVEAAAYYVAAEALANVAKHARATSVRLETRTENGDVLAIRVCDDGTGDVDPARGSGITGLLDRAAALGGRVSVTGNPGAGTVVEARLPAGNREPTR
jgi:signal transduction histidine kinase